MRGKYLSAVSHTFPARSSNLQCRYVRTGNWTPNLLVHGMTLQLIQSPWQGRKFLLTQDTQEIKHARESWHLKMKRKIRNRFVSDGFIMVKRRKKKRNLEKEGHSGQIFKLKSHLFNSFKSCLLGSWFVLGTKKWVRLAAFMELTVVQTRQHC